jgi:hypothetical protein
MTRRQRWLTGPSRHLHSMALVLCWIAAWILFERLTGRASWWQLLAGLVLGAVACYSLVWIMLALVCYVAVKFATATPEFPCPVCGYDIRETLNAVRNCNGVNCQIHPNISLGASLGGFRHRTRCLALSPQN